MAAAARKGARSGLFVTRGRADHQPRPLGELARADQADAVRGSVGDDGDAVDLGFGRVGDLTGDASLRREGVHQEQEGAADERAAQHEERAQAEREAAAEHHAERERP